MTITEWIGSIAAVVFVVSWYAFWLGCLVVEGFR